jgi:hypothetical protein
MLVRILTCVWLRLLPIPCGICRFYESQLILLPRTNLIEDKVCLQSTIYKGVLFYDRPNSLLLVIEPVLFTNLNICGRFEGIIGEFGRNWPEK